MKRLSIVLLFAATAALPAAAQLGGPPIELTEHPYAKKGDWEVRWFTDSRGAFVHADMIRSYENGTALRLVWGKDLNAVDFFGPTQEIVEAGRAEVTWYFDNPDPGTVMANTAVIHPDNNGDLWLRINQRTDEPGVEDALSNAGSVTFHSGTNVWKFDLKGSNAAYKAFLDCFHQQTGAGGTAPAPTTTVPAPAPGPAMAPAGGGTVPAGAGVPGEHSYATVGDWRVTFVNDNTGAFSRAVATRHYANSTSLRVVV
ncbi:MAG: hypothetical protein KDM91_21815, partial [Verrucomicrobiae bacterium]|nr:hypothetical protein [Verrucomicrobiae bacterium]